MGFVDADDWIDSEMYERLYQLAEEYHVSMVSSGYYREGNYTSRHHDGLEEGFYGKEQMSGVQNCAIYDLGKKEPGIKAFFVRMLIASPLVRKCYEDFPLELKYAEDKMFMLTCILNTDSIYITHQPFYHYRINPASVTQNPMEDYLLNIHYLYSYFKRLYAHPNFTDAMRLQAEIFITEQLYKGINKLMGFSHSNILWIDPYWMEIIPGGAKVVLYGGGELGAHYRKQMEGRPDLSFVVCVDFGYNRYRTDEIEVKSPEILHTLEYDYIVITIKNSAKAQEAREQLLAFGITPEKLIWKDQTEIFWRFAEVQGLLYQN